MEFRPEDLEDASDRNEHVLVSKRHCLRLFLSKASMQDMPQLVHPPHLQNVRQMLDLVPHADSVTKLTARCQYCAQSGVTTAAPFTVRFSVADQRQEVVGGAERYAAVCRQHFGRMLGHDAAAPEGDADAQAAT